MACPVFSSAISDLVASVALSGSIVGFYEQSEGTATVVEVDHSEDAEFALAETRVTEATGARVTVDVSRTTAGSVALVVERISGEGTGDLAIVGTRVGLLS